MIINSIYSLNVENLNGYVDCNSRFYSCKDVLGGKCYYFTQGINKLVGDIDSGIWGVSYFLSMYGYKPKNFSVFKDELQLSINGNEARICDVLKHSCYLDNSYPLFSTQKTAKKLIASGLKHTKKSETTEDIRKLFCLDLERFDRPLRGVGNELYRAMAAIGYSHGKHVFCMPWLSKRRYEACHKHMDMTLGILESLNEIVILPISD